MKYKCPICGAVSDERDIPVNPMLLPDDTVCKCPDCGEWSDMELWEEVEE